MINLNWSFSLRSDNWQNKDLDIWAESIENSINLLDPLSKDIVSSRKNVVFLRCPAHTDYMKNTFVFKSPIDITLDIEIDKSTAKVWCENIQQNLFEKIIDIRFLNLEESGSSPYPIIGIDFLNTFTCDQDLDIAILPAHMHFNDFTAKTGIIPGTYNIGKWSRPVECVFEVKNNKERIEIKKGDALFYLKVNSKETIKIIKVPTPWNEIDICAKLTAAEPFKPLSYRYSSLNNYKKSIADNNNT